MNAKPLSGPKPHLRFICFPPPFSPKYKMWVRTDTAQMVGLATYISCGLNSGENYPWNWDFFAS